MLSQGILQESPTGASAPLSIPIANPAKFALQCATGNQSYCRTGHRLGWCRKSFMIAGCDH